MQTSVPVHWTKLKSGIGDFLKCLIFFFNFGTFPQHFFFIFWRVQKCWYQNIVTSDYSVHGAQDYFGLWYALRIRTSDCNSRIWWVNFCFQKQQMPVLSLPGAWQRRKLYTFRNRSHRENLTRLFNSIALTQIECRHNFARAYINRWQYIAYWK